MKIISVISKSCLFFCSVLQVSLKETADENKQFLAIPLGRFDSCELPTLNQYSVT